MNIIRSWATAHKYTALYFADVTILTIGFGDFFAPNDLGRGLVFPYSVGGIIILGLAVSSICRFATQLGHDKVIKKKLDQRRIKTLSMTVTTSAEKEEKEAKHHITKKWHKDKRPKISAPFDPRQRSIVFDLATTDVTSPKTMKSAYSQRTETPLSPRTPQSWVSGVSDLVGANMLKKTLSRSSTLTFSTSPALGRFTTTSTKIKMLRDERDRFNEMRNLQYQTRKWKKYVALVMSVTAFSILWCGGAVVFHHVEDETYFEALYFCYVSLLTIGYGDFAPKSNPGKPFFVLWSLCAIPTMTILISNMGDTIIASYKRGSFKLGDVTLLPKKGIGRAFLNKYPRLQKFTRDFTERKQQKERLEMGFPVGPDVNQEFEKETEDIVLEELATAEALDEHDLAQKLVDAIRDTANYLRSGDYHEYTYEEWVEYTRLIRFTQFDGRKGSTALLLDEEERDEGIIEWDWIGEDSPMMANVSETEWILDRLTESLDRYMKHQIPELKKRKDDNKRRRRSARGSLSAELQRFSNRVEETGFMPVKLAVPEGPRKRANSTQRTAMSPTRRPSVPWQRSSTTDGTVDGDDTAAAATTYSSSKGYFPQGPSTISTQIAEGDTDPPSHPLGLVTRSDEARESNDLQRFTFAPAGARRHTVAAKKGKQTQKNRSGSSDGMQSLAAMRMRRQQ